MVRILGILALVEGSLGLFGCRGLPEHLRQGCFTGAWRFGQTRHYLLALPRPIVRWILHLRPQPDDGIRDHEHLGPRPLIASSGSLFPA